MSAPDQSLRKQRAVLLILLATSERALEAFQVADNVIDETFVEDLERIIARTQKEIRELSNQMGEET
jgi:flagellin-specific chaperone FliS